MVGVTEWREQFNMENNKIVVAQFWTTNINYSKYTEAINRKYCEDRGYIYHVEKNDNKIKSNLFGRSITWYKPKLIKDVFEKYNPEYVLFLDADAVIVNDRYSIQDFIDENYNIICTEDHGPSTMNAGVFIMKNSEWTKNFLDKWWDICETLVGGERNEPGYYKNGLWHDQTCFGYLMDNDEDVKKNIKQISNKVLNGRIYQDEQHKNFIFHAFAYGLTTFRTLDEVYYQMFNIEQPPIHENFIYPETDTNKKMIAIVHHSFLVGDWKNIITKQLERLKISGLYDAADIIRFTTNVVDVDQENEFKFIIKDYDKIVVDFFYTNDFEYPGIKTVKDLGDKYDNLKILYFHAKGVSNTYSDINTKTPSVKKIENIKAWKECLEYFVIDNWRDCVRKLDYHDNVGASCNNGWYWGNFWWSQSKHIKTCSVVDKWNRWDYEAWLNKDRNDVKNFQYFNFTFNPYLTNIDKTLYIGPMRNIDSKIVLVKAEYGTLDFQIDEGYSSNQPFVRADVTSYVDMMLKETNHSFFDIHVTNEKLGGDPIYGEKKFLFLSFYLTSNKDKIYEFGIDEGKNFNFRF